LAGDPLQIPLGELTALPRPLAGTKGSYASKGKRGLQGVAGEERKRRGGEERDEKEGESNEGRGKEVECVSLNFH